MQHRTRYLAGFSAVVLALMMATTATGYTGQVAGSITVAVKGSSTCGHPITVTATLLDAAGKPIAGKAVDWTLALKLSSGDKINKTPTATNSKGVATTTVTLACVNGSRQVRASSGGVFGGAVLSATSQGLPRTSTELPHAPSTQDSGIAALLLAAFGFTIGGLMLLRRPAAMRA